MFKNFLVVFIVISLIWVYVSACNQEESTKNLVAVENFDLDKYLGDWYEIARLPHVFEKNMEYVKATYSLNSDGTVKVQNSGMKNGKAKSIVGIAKFKGAENIGDLQVSFFRPFWGQYKIIYLSEDYSLAIVTSSTKHYLWLLARTPKIDKKLTDEFLKKTETWGFDTEKIIFVKQ